MFLFIVFSFSKDPPVYVMIEWVSWLNRLTFTVVHIVKYLLKTLKGLGDCTEFFSPLVFCFLRQTSADECLKIFWTAGPSCIEIKILGLILIS